jgi:hypothetical protein
VYRVPVLVIAPDNDAVLVRMIRLPRDGMPWRLEQWQARERWIDLRYRARGGAFAIVRLVAREQPVPPATFPSRVTEYFRIVVLRSSPDAELPPLMEILATQVQAHEAEFRWIRKHTLPELVRNEPRDVEVERLAFEAGIKPALRLRFEAWEAAYEAAIWLRAGAAASVVELDVAFAPGVAYVMVAHTRARADALVDAELRQYLPSPTWLDAARDCGELLGYPRCCIEAFVHSISLESGDEDSRVEARRSNFRRLDLAWVPAPHPHLNTLRFREDIGLISFEPCSLACPAALAIADRVAAVIESACPGYCAGLRGAFAIDLDDRRVAIELDDDRRVRAARATHDEAADFAARIVGHQVDDEGRISTLPEPCRVFEFR